MRYLPLLMLIMAPVSVLADEKTSAAPTHHALLVGCTTYPNLPLGAQLRGPANDVLLMRDLLVKRFGFPDKNVMMLSEDMGEKRGELFRPTRANIQREFQRLARVARKGDLVYVHLSGHGAQQPQKDPDDPESYEPDGQSEIFLPGDVGQWDDDQQGVANAIIDVEFRDWLKAIRKTGASLVVVVDTCHSGTMIRGTEKVREVSREALAIPKKAIDEAKKKAENRAKGAVTRGKGDDEPPSFQMASHVPDLVAIYAARPDEPTIEDRFPKEGTDRKPYGLLTFTMVQVVTQSPRLLTYRELVQRIHARYVEMGRSFPVPSVEGKDRDKEFLGQKSWPGRSRVRLKKTPDGWKVNAGALQGLTLGSILTVFPPADEVTKVGHVKVTKLGTLDAEVRPCAYADMPQKDDLPDEGNCKVAFMNFGLDRLKVAVDAKETTRNVRLLEMFRKIEKSANSLIQPVGKPEDADWLVRDMGDGVALVPASGWAQQRGKGPDQYFGPVPVNNDLPAWLEKSLQSIARAKNLLKLAASMEQDQGLEEDAAYAPKVIVELLRFPKMKGKAPEKIVWGTEGVTLHEGDVIAFQLTNKGRQAVDVTLLFVDNHYGIEPFFPDPGQDHDNRVLAGQSVQTPKARINAKTMGLEHVVVITVLSSATKEKADFSCLAQPSLEQARKVTRGPADDTLETPFGKLLQTGLFGTGVGRGISRQQYRNYAMQVVSWTTMPKKGGR